MIKDIEELKNKQKEHVIRFIENCTIEEKIDAYFVCVELRSRNNMVFIKANGKTIDRCDLILNEMWQQLIKDWSLFKIVNQEWFNSHIGYKIYMFYLPCNKPILTEYKDNVSYIIDRMELGQKVITYNCKDEMKNMKFLDKFNIQFKTLLSRKETSNEIIENKVDEAIKSNTPYKDILLSLIDPEKAIIYAKKEPEGYIFKSGKHIYQTITDRTQNRNASAEKTQYEYLLLDFIKFWNSDENIVSLLDSNYIKTVCNLFNHYIDIREKNSFLSNNFEGSSLESPCVGKRFDVCYTNIPDEKTVSLCKEKLLYKNIFKILLVNLKRMKDTKHRILMNARTSEQWNDIVRTISNSTINS